MRRHTRDRITAEPGTRRVVERDAGTLHTGDPLPLRVTAVRGARPGPTLFVMAAIHGDEVVGVEVIRRLVRDTDPAALAGTLLLVPVANPFGFVTGSRYAQDGGDLNRSFPGKADGSASARIARRLFEEVVARADAGIELHTAAERRRNVPQVRVSLDDGKAADLARAFAPPYLLHSNPPKGSVREAGAGRGIPVILYETGEKLRIDEPCVAAGVGGCRRVMRHLGMLAAAAGPPPGEPAVFRRMTWVRAGRGGLITRRIDLGERVREGQPVAWVADPLTWEEHPVPAPRAGTAIGLTTNPLVHPGDHLCHLAWTDAAEAGP
jgi:predicted deacylase